MLRIRDTHTFTRRIALWAAVGLLLLAPAALLAQKTPEPSGFLDDYSKLAEDPEEKGSKLVYRNPDYELYDFDALYLEEPVLMIYPQEEADPRIQTRRSSCSASPAPRLRPVPYDTSLAPVPRRARARVNTRP